MPDRHQPRFQLAVSRNQTSLANAVKLSAPSLFSIKHTLSTLLTSAPFILIWRYFRGISALIGRYSTSDLMAVACLRITEGPTHTILRPPHRLPGIFSRAHLYGHGYSLFLSSMEPQLRLLSASFYLRINRAALQTDSRFCRWLKQAA